MPNSDGKPQESSGYLITAVLFAFAAAVFLNGLPMTIFAWNGVTLALSYCGVAMTFVTSVFFAIKGARTPILAVISCLAIGVLAVLATYVHYIVWWTH